MIIDSPTHPTTPHPHISTTLHSSSHEIAYRHTLRNNGTGMHYPSNGREAGDGEGKDRRKRNQWLMIDPLGALFREWAGRVWFGAICGFNLGFCGWDCHLKQFHSIEPWLLEVVSLGNTLWLLSINFFGVQPNCIQESAGLLRSRWFRGQVDLAS